VSAGLLLQAERRGEKLLQVFWVAALAERMALSVEWKSAPIAAERLARRQEHGAEWMESVSAGWFGRMGISWVRLLF